MRHPLIGRSRLPLIQSVRGRLALLVLAVMLPALLFAVALIFQAYRNERAAVADKVLGTARALTGILDGEVSEASIILRSLGSSGAMKREDFQTLAATASEILAGDERWFVLLDETGRQLVNTRLPFEAPKPTIEFDPEFAAAMHRNEEYVSNLRFGPVADSLVVHVSQPIFVAGRFKYALCLVMLPGTLGRSLNVDRIVPGSVISIIDREGTMIARTHSPEKYVGGKATPDMVAQAATRAEGVADSVTLEGIAVLASFSRAASGWSVLVGVPKSELYAPGRRLLYAGLGAAGFLALIATVMALWIGRTVVRGVDALSADAVTVGRGEVPAGHSSGVEEIDSVSRTLRHTAGTLRRRAQILETLNHVSAGLLAERDLEKIIQIVTDAGREISGAEFGVFYHCVPLNGSEAGDLSLFSGSSREPFETFGLTRDAPLFAPTLRGEGVIRVADLSSDPRFAAPSALGAAAGRLAIRSYLAVPVQSQQGNVIGGLFFGHSSAGVFTAEVEAVVIGLAATTAIAIDSAKLYQTLARELEAKSKVETELRLAQLDLERKVEERTASLREAITQMEEFSYSVSHDLRSPLRAMYAYASALVEDYGTRLDDTARNYSVRILRSAERMDRLTRDVLSYSRIGRSEVKAESIDIEQLVLGTLEHYSELQPAVADVRVLGPLHRVLAHEPSLTQCVANLLTNAVKFVRPGEKPSVTVRSERRGDRIRLWVEDRGIGILPKFQARLFRMFERVPTDHSFDGTGIGLAIVRKAVEKMGGSCGVESDGATGSRFWIELAAG